MKLKTARICLDCNEVFDAPRCPACGGEHCHYLARWLNRAVAQLETIETGLSQTLKRHDRALSRAAPHRARA